MEEKQPLPPITGKNKKKTQYLKTDLSDQVEDPHAKLSIEEKLKMKPSELVPQLANQTMRKRDAKQVTKEQERDRLR